MLVKALKAKIHRATVTDTKVDYPGSLAVDQELLDAVGIYSYEAVLIANVTNGNRAETYVIPAERGSGKIEVLGGAARLYSPGDVVIIMNFSFFSPEEAEGLKPKVIAVDEKNRLKEYI
jgi:aspartate 1-decarboxylase